MDTVSLWLISLLPRAIGCKGKRLEVFIYIDNRLKPMIDCSINGIIRRLQLFRHREHALKVCHQDYSQSFDLCCEKLIKQSGGFIAYLYVENRRNVIVVGRDINETLFVLIYKPGKSAIEKNGGNGSDGTTLRNIFTLSNSSEGASNQVEDEDEVKIEFPKYFLDGDLIYLQLTVKRQMTRVGVLTFEGCLQGADYTGFSALELSCWVIRAWKW
ncbi:hypothetical protein POM88_052761 [Heracleum sosnowskyi]|uniref:Uncharacterized protein n=1 Tax=Heracleum sosnowskyi TaxID=360622 RepID=A0AAD8LYD0_9APIA|nr:hypothetical protein POM88_052761 [Heracleum sosnowskyi]